MLLFPNLTIQDMIQNFICIKKFAWKLLSGHLKMEGKISVLHKPEPF